MKKSMIMDNVILYRFGSPMEFGTILKDGLNFGFVDTNKIEYFKFETKSDHLEFVYDLSLDDKIYGLGETTGPINKRGACYETYNTDTTEHYPSTKSLYSSLPFLIVIGSKSFAFLIDYPSKIAFDIGFTNKDIFKIKVFSKDFDFYIIKGKDPRELIKNYLKLVGEPFVPPKWAFGYQQSRWSYPTKDKVLDIARTFRQKNIPCDAIYLDLDYMDDYKIFTTNDDNFKDFERFSRNMSLMGFKLVPIIDPGVKIEKNYYVYESGIQKDVFCKDKDDNNFIGAVWPGLVHFPDFLNDNVKLWWGDLYKKFVDIGIVSFWNDMNEPSIFYTPESLNSVENSLKDLAYSNGIETLIHLSSLEDKLHGKWIYTKFYHRIGLKKVNHNDVHNLYGFSMAKATADGLKRLSDQRYFLLSRSAYVGAHRFTSIWMGDNKSWWEHLKMNMNMLISLNMAGFFYTGADIGGFGDDCNSKLMIRWTQLGIFTPLFRNHSAIDTRNQEPWAFDVETEKILKDLIKLRYALVPYLYSEFMKSVRDLTPVVTPLFFNFNDPEVYDIEDQFLYGSSVMLAPIYTPYDSRFVYLPEDSWLLWKAKNYLERNLQILKPGAHLINTDVSEIPIFIKHNSMIVLTKPMNYVGEEQIKELTVIAFVDSEAEYVYYDDNGKDYSYKDGNFLEIYIKVKKSSGFYDIIVKNLTSYECGIDKINFEIYDSNLKLYKFTRRVS